MEFDKIKRILEGIPVTWYPAIIDIMVRESYKKKNWLEKNSFSKFVSKIENKLKYDPPPVKTKLIKLTCNKCFKTFEGKGSDIHSKCIIFTCSGVLHHLDQEY